MLSIFLIGAALSADIVEIDESSDREVIYRQKTEIDFEALDIEGILVKPSSSLILERKKAAFNPLVKIRTDWNDTIEESIDEAK